MSKDLQKIVSFLDEHHVLTLATSSNNLISSCNLFYVFDEETLSFIVASSDDTLHVQQTRTNPNIAGTVVLETKTISKIQGLQFRGEFLDVEDESLKKHYFKAFPYALAMLPKLWQIKVSYFKLTDNRLGFGKKIVYRV